MINVKFLKRYLYIIYSNLKIIMQGNPAGYAHIIILRLLIAINHIMYYHYLGKEMIWTIMIEEPL